jgi:biopolymer transport protein ExbD
MVAAPLSTVDLPIDLPSSTATPQKKPDKPTYVSIKPDLSLAIGEKSIKRAELISTLNAAAESNPERLVFVRADRGVAYGDLMDVLELLRQGNYRMKLVALEGVADASVPSPTSGAARP